MCLRTEEEIAERELIRACFHEVSHGVIAEHFGVYGEAYVWRNEDYLERGESAWLGNIQFADLNNKLTLTLQKMIGMAGVLGEEIALAKFYEKPEEQYIDEIVVNFDDAYYCGSLSESDRRMIGTEFDVDDVREITRLLLHNWTEIDELANKLKQLVQSSKPKQGQSASLVISERNFIDFFGIAVDSAKHEPLECESN